MIWQLPHSMNASIFLAVFWLCVAGSGRVGATTRLVLGRTCCF